MTNIKRAPLAAFDGRLLVLRGRAFEGGFLRGRAFDVWLLVLGGRAFDGRARPGGGEAERLPLRPPYSPKRPASSLRILAIGPPMSAVRASIQDVSARLSVAGKAPGLSIRPPTRPPAPSRVRPQPIVCTRLRVPATDRRSRSLLSCWVRAQTTRLNLFSIPPSPQGVVGQPLKRSEHPLHP